MLLNIKGAAGIAGKLLKFLPKVADKGMQRMIRRTIRILQLGDRAGGKFHRFNNGFGAALAGYTMIVYGFLLDIHAESSDPTAANEGLSEWL